jgi:hypothetical protein
MTTGGPDAKSMVSEDEGETTCLNVCDLKQCQAQCCYDGVYLREGEEQRLREVVASAPEYFDLPEEWIVDGHWNGDFEGRKTATKPHEFDSDDVPAHFNATRCVFCDSEHKCLLQRLAVDRGLHKWAYKPRSCWLFPLTEAGDELRPPPGPSDPDPNDLGPEYPGYVKYAGCGRHRHNGQRWTETLAEEIEHWRNHPRRKKPSGD